MTMLAEVIDAAIGIDTHRDSHEVEIADVAGTPITKMRIGNDSAGFTQLLAAAEPHEVTRPYRIWHGDPYGGSHRANRGELGNTPDRGQAYEPPLRVKSGAPSGV
jgi:hypothetical protein